MPRTKTKATAAPAPPVKETSDEQFKRRRAEQAAKLDLVDLEDRERSFLAACQRLYREESGDITPFNEFFAELVRTAIIVDYAVTPNDVDEHLEEFKENFTRMAAASEPFIERYKDYLNNAKGTK